ncbi:hypothetical protein AYL99_05930 [Fonsecaea erecta]|uniref:Protein kinase domain-containing protein n=1 Tax=Fonsecaea erecta TaxID=1367422 RepID=A0A178ZM90_9EURO|nr:hypothetical protein AYL99_05930 [Fonsecaea erecta]OAP60928.1 hypothetical protein AYL99_05930 [Fonsecaea erecta]
MYLDWPESPADLVPLPRCDGPKLKPFNFKGSQEIEFLEYLGEGLHAHVFKVKIELQIYALKLFRFPYDEDWLGPEAHTKPDDLEAMSAFYNYSEPFSCECRAFGRLQEDGYEELAVKCLGYLLLDEEHERTMMNRFSHLKLEFNGNCEIPGLEDMRGRFLGRDGRHPPIRCIVKEFGQAEEPLRNKDMKRILRDIIRLHQLGIIDVDMAHRQLIGGKLGDFSTAVTVPHFMVTPELNPRLTPEWISAMEFETFQFSINDFWDFDSTVQFWNFQHENPKDHISVHAFPSGYGCRIKYDLRPTPSRERVYTFVDPRLYDWKTSVAASAEASGTGGVSEQSRGQQTKGRSCDRRKGAVTKTRRRLDAKPPRWYYDCDSKVTAKLKRSIMFSTSLEWEFKDGLIFPRRRH